MQHLRSCHNQSQSSSDFVKLKFFKSFYARKFKVYLCGYCCMLKVGALGLSPDSFLWFWLSCSSKIGLNFMLWNKLIFLLASPADGPVPDGPPCIPNPAWLKRLWGWSWGLTGNPEGMEAFFLSSELGLVFLGGGAVSSMTYWKYFYDDFLSIMDYGK